MLEMQVFWELFCPTFYYIIGHNERQPLVIYLSTVLWGFYNLIILDK